MLCFSGDGSGNVSENMMYSSRVVFLFLLFFCVCLFFFFLRFRFTEAGNREKRFDHGSQNREVRPWFSRVPAIFPWSGS